MTDQIEVVPATDTNPILVVNVKNEMDELLNNLVGHSTHSATLDATIQRLEKEKRTAVASRDIIEAQYIHGTLASIAALFQAENVAYKDINAFMLSCMELTKDNWAFKASNGAPIGVSSIKNWKKCSDEELQKTYEAVSKGEMFATWIFHSRASKSIMCRLWAYSLPCSVFQ